MINVSLDTPIPSVNTTLEIIRAHNRMMPTFVDMDKTFQHASYFMLKARQIKGPLYDAIEYKDSYEIGIARWLQRWLINRGDTEGLMTAKTGLSLGAKSIAQAKELGKMSPEAFTVLDSYVKFQNYNKTARTLLGYLQFPIVNMLSYDKHRMCVLTLNWAAQNTNRIGMYDPAIQNLPHEVQDILTVPYGWIYVHTDSGQIEPRSVYSAFITDPQIKYLIELYDDAYYGLWHYVTLSDEEVASGRCDFVAREITDEIAAARKIIKRDCNAVVYGSKSNPSGDPIKAALIKRIGGHRLRLAWIRRIEEDLDRGIHVFKTAFGTPIDINNSPKLEDIDSGYEREEKIKLAINNPIQGTAADLMRLSVSRAATILSNKAKNSAILNYVHDAGTFAIHQDDWDKVSDEIKDIVAYNVEGWIPIKADPEIGRNCSFMEDYY